MELAVALCVTRPPGPRVLEPALRALAGHAPQLGLIVVAPQEQLAATETAAAAHAPAAGVFCEPLANRAALRNRALRVSEADVLVFLDDDVVVDDAWAPAVARAWEEAGEDVACVGGAVAIAPTPRPAWLGAELERFVGGVDLGPARELDAPLDVVAPGNLGFRRGPILEIGGFEERFGDPAFDDWFSETSAAQRGLRHAGLRILWEPSARAERLVGAGELRPRAVLARSRRYGARLAGAGALERPAAASQAARAAAGTALAVARRDPALAMGRALRAAEAAGALAGRSRPRASPPPPRAPAAHGADTALVLLYHRVADDPDDRLGLAVSPAHFAEQLEVLTADWRPMALEELAVAARAGRVPDRAVAVSFDDGYADNLEHAAPALAEAGVPATFFVASGFLGADHEYWWDELARLLAHAPGPEIGVACATERQTHPLTTPQERADAHRELHAWVQIGSAARIADVLAQLRDISGAAPATDGGRPLSPEGLRALAASPGATIGSHTVTHPNLAYRSLAAQRREAADSRAALREATGQDIALFSYPFGMPGQDFTAATQEIVAAAGYGAAVTNGGGGLTAASDPFALPRVAAPDAGGEAFARRLDDAYAAAKAGRPLTPAPSSGT
jgi:peptidoglycan/xylan/chitin deacetylase (PgdA/CDA1 family)